MPQHRASLPSLPGDTKAPAFAGCPPCPSRPASHRAPRGEGLPLPELSPELCLPSPCCPPSTWPYLAGSRSGSETAGSRAGTWVSARLSFGTGLSRTRTQEKKILGSTAPVAGTSGGERARARLSRPVLSHGSQRKAVCELGTWKVVQREGPREPILRTLTAT